MLSHRAKLRGLVLVLSAVALAFTIRPVQAQNAVPEDKVMHFSVAAGLHSTCYAVAKSITDSKWASQVGCYVLVNGAAALKEYNDKGNGGTRDPNDIYANLAGSGLSFAVISVAF